MPRPLIPPALVASVRFSASLADTYHHKREELPDALSRAQEHLSEALRIQQRQLGPKHISTLCSQLVKAQVMLLQSNHHGCGALLQRQLAACEGMLSSEHPLVAKMLAVRARLHSRQGELEACERLQSRVLSMRRDALGLHHEDTHRSAMDVYSRRRQQVLRVAHDETSRAYVLMAAALEVCLAMLVHAASETCGLHGFALSKSLQGMGEVIFQDIGVLAKMAIWPREQTLTQLDAAADTAERLPPTPLCARFLDVDAAAAATAAGEAVVPHPPPPSLVHGPLSVEDLDESGELLSAHALHRRDRLRERQLLVFELRKLRAALAAQPEWPPPPYAHDADEPHE
eukprot:CAMPEP_0115834006 /NCGR_PEP_ID=MMETSP0287-20121206/3464_1 /TAXON_ID=412157 /ORGANISM="Chrysochromulina rotalis, Strain UIO044" /LENGTH=342 /DNA_ID=CAMNT_0003287435 /DNA_START=1 /DNA_END=1029 /DNA_ORIENTATION=+